MKNSYSSTPRRGRRTRRVRWWLVAVTACGVLGVGGRFAWSMTGADPLEAPRHAYLAGPADQMRGLCQEYGLEASGLPQGSQKVVIDLGTHLPMAAPQLDARDFRGMVDSLEQAFLEQGRYPDALPEALAQQFPGAVYQTDGGDFELTCGRLSYSSLNGYQSQAAAPQAVAARPVVEVKDSRWPWAGRHPEVDSDEPAWSFVNQTGILASSQPANLTFPPSALPQELQAYAGSYSYFEAHLDPQAGHLSLKGFHQQSKLEPEASLGAPALDQPFSLVADARFAASLGVAVEGKSVRLESSDVITPGRLSHWAQLLARASQTRPQGSDLAHSLGFDELPGPALAGGQFEWVGANGEKTQWRWVAGRNDGHDWLQAQACSPQRRLSADIPTGQSEFEQEFYNSGIRVASAHDPQ
ncbi:MAG: hypothetical protein KC910_12210 [Candidatus Eremiobacteraeota bacterium]|nr:hypothetical protein [Candidatus Eremiobacteraeota bacterium]